MNQPEGFVSQSQENLVFRLKKSIWGLKQSPRCWNQALDAQLKELGFKQSSNDPWIYVSTTDSLLFLAVYADNIVPAGKSQQTIKKVKTNLGENHSKQSKKWRLTLENAWSKRHGRTPQE